MFFHLDIVPTSIHEWLQDWTMIIDAIPGTWSAGQPKKYEPVTVSWPVEFQVLGN